MITSEQLTGIGRMGKPHGINGEINAYLDVDVDTTALSRIVLPVDGIFVPFFISGIRSKGPDTLILAIDDINNERDAATLTNLPLYVITADNVVEDSDDTADSDGMYASDLVGYTVALSPSDEPLGTIEDIDDTTDNVLFIVKDSTGSALYIPVADEFIDDIDTAAHTIVMTLPEGILDL